MALRDWSRRRIGILWLAGLLFYGGLVVLGGIRRREDEQQWRERFGPVANLGAAPETISAVRRDSLASLMFALLRETSRGSQAHRDSVAQQLAAFVHGPPLNSRRRDSLYGALNVPARLNEAQQDSLRASAKSLITPIVEPIVAGAVKGVSGIGAWLVVAAILLLTPGIALITVTALWVHSRHTRSLNSDAAAV
jgi:hypothetical protein